MGDIQTCPVCVKPTGVSPSSSSSGKIEEMISSMSVSTSMSQELKAMAIHTIVPVIVVEFKVVGSQPHGAFFDQFVDRGGPRRRI